MSDIISQMVAMRLKRLSTDELLHYADQYNFSITKGQARDIISYMQQNRIEPFDPDSRAKMFQELENITDKTTAQQAQRLLQELIRSYGLEDMFKQQG